MGETFDESKKNLKRKIKEHGGRSKMMKNDNVLVVTEIIDIDDKMFFYKIEWENYRLFHNTVRDNQ